LGKAKHFAKRKEGRFYEMAKGLGNASFAPVPITAQDTCPFSVLSQNNLRKSLRRSLIFHAVSVSPGELRDVRKSRKPKGFAQIRKEKRSAGEFWGYDVWIRQPDGSRRRYREFTFATKLRLLMPQALASLRTTGWKTRYGVRIVSTEGFTPELL